MKSLTFLFLSFGLCLIGMAQKPYPHLETMSIMNICGDVPQVLIHYDRTLGKEINEQRNKLPSDHRMYLTEDFEATDIVALELRFTASTLPGTYYLLFSFGPSCDPGFYFYNPETNEYIEGALGLELFVPGGSSVYSTGHANTTYNTRRKYTFNGTKFEEVVPEFYYVGLETKTLKPLTIYTDEDLTRELAKLPSNYEIEVVAAKRTTEGISKIKYLIRTKVGLLGWSQIETTAFTSLQVEGIRFLGD